MSQLPNDPILTQKLFYALVRDVLTLCKIQESKTLKLAPSSSPIIQPSQDSQPAHSSIQPSQDLQLAHSSGSRALKTLEEKPPLLEKPGDNPTTSVIEDLSMHLLIKKHLPELSLRYIVFGLAHSQAEIDFLEQLQGAMKTHLDCLLITTTDPLSLEEQGYLPSLLLSFLPLTSYKLTPYLESLPHLLLDSVENYKIEKQRKKTLWMTLCQMFPRSSLKSS